jgi:aminomethyltransferase
LQGKDAVPFLETLVVGDVAGIKNGSGSLSVFTNEKGGIIDDTVITKVGLQNPMCSCHFAIDSLLMLS